MRGVSLSLMFLGDVSARRTQPDSIAADLNINQLLPENTIKLLLTSTSTEEIAARHEIFRRMEDENFVGAMKNLSESLAILSQITNAYENTEFRISELEGLLLMRARCEAFLDACRCSEALGGDSPLLGNLQKNIKSLAGLRADISEALETTSGCINELSDTSVRLTTGGAIKVKNAGSDDISAKLVELIRGFGCEVNLRVMRQIRICDELSISMAKLHNKTVTKLRTLRSKFEPLFGDEFKRLSREIEFYLDIRTLVNRGIKAGFPLCFPTLSRDKSFRVSGACDYTLLLKDCAVVPNDIDFDADSSVCFLTGANGGGKTTYLRCTAANLLLALGGCPVFARSAEFNGISRIFTHFPADESFTSSGRLVEEAARVDSMLANCDSESFIFMNETYSGTDDLKGAQMTVETAERIQNLGAFALWVTHFHEVADKGYTMLTTVVDDSDTSKRTFRIEKRRGGGSSYARDILRKYKLDAASLAAREA